MALDVRAEFSIIVPPGRVYILYYAQWWMTAGIGEDLPLPAIDDFAARITLDAQPVEHYTDLNYFGPNATIKCYILAREGQTLQLEFIPLADPIDWDVNARLSGVDLLSRDLPLPFEPSSQLGG